MQSPKYSSEQKASPTQKFSHSSISSYTSVSPYRVSSRKHTKIYIGAIDLYHNIVRILPDGWFKALAMNSLNGTNLKFVGTSYEHISKEFTRNRDHDPKEIYIMIKYVRS